MIYDTIYKKLQKLIPDLDDLTCEDNRKSKSGAYMDLNMDVLDVSTKTLKGVGTEDSTFTSIKIALSHYYQDRSGDSIADPDMEIEVWPSRKMAQALTYQDSYGFKQVYPEPGKIYPQLQKELNAFLSTWLTNCVQQGHSLKNDQLIKSQGNDIYINGNKLSITESLRVNNHSPTGFAWGYEGSAPAQLSLAILLEAVPKNVAIQHYQEFKKDVVSIKDTNSPLIITRTEIKEWFDKTIPDLANKAIKKLDSFPNIKEKIAAQINPIRH